MGSGKQYMHSINIGNSSDDVLKEPAKKGERANIADGSPKDHRRNNKLECVIALVSFRSATETSPWCEGNLADKGSGSYYCHSSIESGLSKKSNMFRIRIPLSFL